ncbi:hypothetical protein [Streptomyces sp. NPDC056821]|uniref:hypothetical protein n=1 Tax=Streptomyces sp. NPDC056821 TaxID=3345952 RepID=UPI0036C7767E
MVWIKRWLAGVVAGSSVLMVGAAVSAHENSPRVPEVKQVKERLLISDSESGDVVVVDDGAVGERLSTPPAPLSLARSDDGRTAVAMRGRNTDRDHATFIDTGYDEKTGKARRAFVARTWIAQSPGGVTNGRMPEVAGRIGISEEGAGSITFVDPAGLSGLGDTDATTLRLAGPDHYAFVVGRDGPGEPVLAVGHLRRGGVALLDPTIGRQTAWVGGCPVLHGGTTDLTGRRAIFGCADGLLSVDLVDHTNTKTPYPSQVRAANFHAGPEGIRWGTTEGAQSSIQRIATTDRQPTIEPVDLAVNGERRTQLRTTVATDGSQLIVLTHQGWLQIRDGRTGALSREVRVDRPYPLDYHEHTEKAEMPDLATGGGVVHVSLPRSGRLLTVDLDSGKVVRRLDLGGMPTRIIRLSTTP